MNTITAMDAFRACFPVYQRLIQVPKYKPTLEEQEKLKNFRILYKVGGFDDKLALFSESDLEIYAFLIGYISNQD